MSTLVTKQLVSTVKNKIDLKAALFTAADLIQHLGFVANRANSN